MDLDPNLIMDMLQDPEALRRMFSPNPNEPSNGPPASPAPHTRPDSDRLDQTTTYRIELSLYATFDDWETRHIDQMDELKSIVWSVLTGDPDYQGGVQPLITYVGMRMERKPERAPEHRSIVRQTSAEPGAARARDDDRDDQIDRSRDGEAGQAGGESGQPE